MCGGVRCWLCTSQFFLWDGEFAGQGQGHNGVLAHEGREAPKVGLLICSFQMYSFGRRLNQEVTDKVTAVLAWSVWSRCGSLLYLQGKAEGASVGGTVPDDKGTRLLRPQEIDCLLSSDAWLKPIL